MCGIVGIFSASGPSTIDEAVLRRMNDRQAHRGPDDDGLFVAPGVGLGHRRLSIIDLAGGHQPLFNEDGHVVVVFNGEIYNYTELVPELEAAGHRFRTRSDTEVIVHAWEEWGRRCVERFRGMFAFALWDARAETLFLARDRLGVKPLYHAVLGDRTLLFSSELKGILAHPLAPRAINPQAVEDYFAYGYVPEPKTIYEGIAKLPPATTLVWQRGKAAPVLEEYWDVSFRATRRVSEQDAAAELVAHLKEAVRIRLMSEVPLGAFLSGGVDSSAVVAMMAQLQDEPVDTCAIGFSQQAFDETAFARVIAERYHTRHHVHRVDPEAFDLIDRLVDAYDEPFADSSALPTYQVCALARRHVTVALSGDGGDELFAGYRRYRFHAHEERVRGLLPQRVRGPLFGMLGALYPKLDWAPRPLRAKATLQGLARDSVGGFYHSVSIATDAFRRRLFSPALRRALDGYNAISVLEAAMARAPADDPLSRAQYADLKTYLPGDILVKVDRASMAVALEAREPVLDHVLLEWAASLPADLRLRGGQGKYIFKKAMEPFVPRDILYRPKMGFSMPLAAWLRGPLLARLRHALASDVVQDSGLFDPPTIGRLVNEHASGLRDHSAQLWALLMFEGFLRRVHPADALRPSASATRSAAA